MSKNLFKKIEKALISLQPEGIKGHALKRITTLTALVKGMIDKQSCHLNALGSGIENDINDASREIAAKRFVENKYTDYKLHYLPYLSQLLKTLIGVSMDASEFKEYIFGMLFLKRMSDQFEQRQKGLRTNVYEHLDEEMWSEVMESPTTYGDTFYVPEIARWDKIRYFHHNAGELLDTALAALEEANDALRGGLKDNIGFNRTKGNKRVIPDNKAKDLIDHFDKIKLTNDNFEFPDLLGAAYEYLIKYFADSAGKKGGEFYTPAQVVRLLVQLMKPKAGMEIYDPTAGSGGMLIQSAQFVEEQGQNERNLTLAGQDNNGTVWAICKMNMILHNVLDADIRLGDTVEDLQHTEGGSLRKFDRILANPPFSQNYSRDNMQFSARFRYGYAPETGKKGDLMFVQHMISCLKDNGKMACYHSAWCFVSRRG